MGSLGLSLIAFACIFGATLLGMYLRVLLPAEHLSTESRDAIRLSMGVIGTMAALVLGLLIASAKGTYDAKNTQIRQLTVDIIVLDQLLAQYGPETHALRDLLRRGAASLADRIWSERDVATATKTAFAMTGEAEAFLHKVEELAPQTEVQRSIRARAITTLTDLAQTRLSLYAQPGNAIPWPFLVLLVFWLAIIFASFSLFVPPNPIVVVSFFVCAFSAAGALFLIFELDGPFTGLMTISDLPLRHALGPI
ncbi:MAG: DUF4239 domain-containing protein [Pseudolabrys sp.]